MSEKETFSEAELAELKERLSKGTSKFTTNILLSFFASLVTRVPPNHLERANMKRLGLDPEAVDAHSKN